MVMVLRRIINLLNYRKRGHILLDGKVYISLRKLPSPASLVPGSQNLKDFTSDINLIEIYCEKFVL